MEILISWMLIFIVAVMLLAGCSAAPAVRTGSYRPDISHRQGVIYDHGRPIAKIKGFHLKSVVLVPGGQATIEDWDVSWRGGRGKVTTLEGVSVRQSSPSALEVMIDGRSAGGHYSSTTKITITYSRTLDSYLYEVESTLVKEKFLIEGWYYVDRKTLVYPPPECCRLKFKTPDKWNCCVYRDRDEKFTKIPFNYLMAPDKARQYFPRKGAFLGYFGDSDGVNPVIEFMDATGLNSYGHISASLDSLYLGRLFNNILGHCSDRLSIRYRLCRYDGNRSAPIVKAGRVRKYTDQEKQEYARPRFEPDKVCDFEKAIDLTKTDKAGYWDVFGDILDAEWCTGVARSGKRSLKCVGNLKSSKCWWEPALHTKVYPMLEKGGKYRVTAYVKTKALDGKGAVLECIKLKGGKAFKSQPITGSTGWKKLVVDIPPVSEATGLQIRLLHEGKGESYFDDVRFSRVR